MIHQSIKLYLVLFLSQIITNTYAMNNAIERIIDIHNHKDVGSFLTPFVSDINKLGFPNCGFGKRPVYYAVLNANPHAVKALLQLGANPDLLSDSGIPTLERAYDRYADLGTTDSKRCITILEKFYARKKRWSDLRPTWITAVFVTIISLETPNPTRTAITPYLPIKDAHTKKNNLESL